MTDPFADLDPEAKRTAAALLAVDAMSENRSRGISRGRAVAVLLIALLVGTGALLTGRSVQQNRVGAEHAAAKASRAARLAQAAQTTARQARLQQAYALQLLCTVLVNQESDGALHGAGLRADLRYSHDLHCGPVLRAPRVPITAIRPQPQSQQTSPAATSSLPTPPGAPASPTPPPATPGNGGRHRGGGGGGGSPPPSRRPTQHPSPCPLKLRNPVTGTCVVPTALAGSVAPSDVLAAFVAVVQGRLL